MKTKIILAAALFSPALHAMGKEESPKVDLPKNTINQTQLLALVQELGAQSDTIRAEINAITQRLEVLENQQEQSIIKLQNKFNGHTHSKQELYEN